MSVGFCTSESCSKTPIEYNAFPFPFVDSLLSIGVADAALAPSPDSPSAHSCGWSAPEEEAAAPKGKAGKPTGIGAQTFNSPIFEALGLNSNVNNNYRTLVAKYFV